MLYYQHTYSDSTVCTTKIKERDIKNKNNMNLKELKSKTLGIIGS